MKTREVVTVVATDIISLNITTIVIRCFHLPLARRRVQT